MKALIIYDSVYGNTERIARVISKELNAKLLHVHDVNPLELSDAELVVIGSPVHGGRATPELEELISKIPKNSLKGIKVATFDTRYSTVTLLDTKFFPSHHGIKMWLVMKVVGSAAEQLAKELTKKGAELIAKPQGFTVGGKEGPLYPGEAEIATNWAKNIRVLVA